MVVKDLIVSPVGIIVIILVVIIALLLRGRTMPNPIYNPKSFLYDQEAALQRQMQLESEELRGSIEKYLQLRANIDSEVTDIEGDEERRRAAEELRSRLDDKIEKPWRERKTTKPFPQYRSHYWPQWAFLDYENSGRVIVPGTAANEVVGSVFPDDFIIVNREWRRVCAIITTHKEPVITIEPHGKPVEMNVLKR